MKHPKSIQITIPHPCSQNWDEMTSVDQGKFCAHCQKKVTDFTEWSDSALYSFFSKNTDHVCGRFLSSQVNRTLNIPYQPNSQLYRIAVALGLTILLAQSPQLNAQNRPPKTEQNPLLKPVMPATNATGEILGRILNSKKKPVRNAFIKLYCGDVLKGLVFTDFEGNYIFSSLDPGQYNLEASNDAYNTITINNIMVLQGERTTVRINMQRRPKNNHRDEIQHMVTGLYEPDKINDFFLLDKIKNLPK